MANQATHFSALGGSSEDSGFWRPSGFGRKSHVPEQRAGVDLSVVGELGLEIKSGLNTITIFGLSDTREISFSARGYSDPSSHCRKGPGEAIGSFLSHLSSMDVLLLSWIEFTASQTAIQSKDLKCNVLTFLVPNPSSGPRN